MKIGLLAGEASGDTLGAGLMSALSELASDDVTYVGVGGEQMRAAGLESLASLDELAVNGFREPLLRLPQLIGLYRRLVDELSEAQLDAFVGVDFNVFNFLVEKALKRRGVRTAHYVSPSVYAWRKGRARRVADKADVLLCLYPFEPAFYEPYPLEAVFVGHPLADEIDLEAGSESARRDARERLQLPTDGLVLALLPGSRGSEVALMLDDFLEAAERFRQLSRLSRLSVVIPCVNQARLDQVRDKTAGQPHLDIVLHEGNARTPLVAADVALVKAGTSTLEAMLLGRPMVVSYRLGRLSYQLARHLVRTPHVALPNILLGRGVVPELLQDEGTPEALAGKLREELDKSLREPEYLGDFRRMHETLRRDANREAAAAVYRLAVRADDDSRQGQEDSQQGA
jgi:lipid-A-disaccharide synthase